MRALCAPLPLIAILAVSSVAFGRVTTPSVTSTTEMSRTAIQPVAAVANTCDQKYPDKASQEYKLCACAEMYPTETSQEYKICKGIILTRGSLAYRAPVRPWKRIKYVTPALVKILIEEGKRVLAKPQNKWMKLNILLGLATVESDFRWWLQLKDRRGADCGITQNRVSEPTIMPRCAKPGVPIYRCWAQECKKLASYSKVRQSIRASFELGMKEMNDIRNQWCCLRGDKRVNEKGRKVCRGRYWNPGVDQLRCIFNVYNQGPKYSYNRRWRQCKPKRHEWSTTASIAKRRLRCQRITRYHLHVLCFAKGYELGSTSKRPCRHAWSYGWIKRAYPLSSRK